MVLLLGDRPGAAVDLASGVASCVAGLPSQPVLYMVTEDAEVADSVGELLRAGGISGASAVLQRLTEAQLSDFLTGITLPMSRQSSLSANEPSDSDFQETLSC
jgi:hypothetical protein